MATRTTTKTVPAKTVPAPRGRQKAPAKTEPAPRSAKKAQRTHIDDRLKSMSSEALFCRSWGHAPLLLPVPGPEAVKYRRRGQKLVLIGCRNQCSYNRRVVLDASTKETISDHTDYADRKSYLVQQRGSGRVRRYQSRNAFFELVAAD